MAPAVHQPRCKRPLDFGDLLLLRRQNRREVGGKLARFRSLSTTLTAVGTALLALGFVLGVKGLELLHLGIGQVEGLLHRRFPLGVPRVHRRAPRVRISVRPLGTGLLVTGLPVPTSFATLTVHPVAALRVLGAGEQLLLLLGGERRREVGGKLPQVAVLRSVEGLRHEQGLGIGEVERFGEPLAVLGVGRWQEDKQSEGGEQPAPEGGVHRVGHRSEGW